MAPVLDAGQRDGSSAVSRGGPANAEAAGGDVGGGGAGRGGAVGGSAEAGEQVADGRRTAKGWTVESASAPQLRSGWWVMIVGA